MKCAACGRGLLHEIVAYIVFLPSAPDQRWVLCVHCQAEHRLRLESANREAGDLLEAMFSLDFFASRQVTLPAVIVQVTDTPAKTVDLDDLRAACKRHGITQDAIAASANVTRPLVVNVFARRSKSQNVVDTATRLVTEAKAALKLARARKRAENGAE